MALHYVPFMDTRHKVLQHITPCKTLLALLRTELCRTCGTAVGVPVTLNESVCALCVCVCVCCVVLCCAVLCWAVRWCVVLCCAVLCCAVLCCAVLCCAVLCCA